MICNFLRKFFIFNSGPETAAEVNHMLKAKGLENKFPLFTAVHSIFTNQMKPEELIDMLRQHPLHENPSEYSLA